MDFWKKWNNSQKAKPGKPGKFHMLPRITGVIFSVVFLGIGFYRGELTDIYRKAVMICLECIGIG